MKTITRQLVLFFVLITLSVHAFGQGMKERRVYYLDATYSMINPSKLWDSVRKDLANAINAIDDADTEIYVVAFGGNMGTELKTWYGLATEEGKRQVISGFMGFSPKIDTMTYLDRPLNDFYQSKADMSKVTYCFLMTDGKDENKDTNKFPNSLKKWGGKYGNSNVYGFYVMLNQEAQDSRLQQIIDGQKNLWLVQTADVNINLVRLSKKATLNVRSESNIEIPIIGKADNLRFTATMNSSSGIQVNSSKVKDGKLIVSISVVGNIATMPESSVHKLNISATNAGDFDILVTDEVSVTVLNKYERVVFTPVSNQNMGKASDYPKCLFVDSKTVPARHRIEFSFNEDAVANPNTFAEFQFVDNDGRPVGQDVIRVRMNGEQLKNNSFKVTPSDPVVNFEIEFAHGAETGKHQGYFRLVNHNIHRVNNNFCDSQPVDACKWTVYYRPRMNPLAQGILALLIVAVFAFLLWMLLLKPIFHPRFGSIQKSFNIPGMAPLIVKFKGARGVVVSAMPVKKQSGWNRFWTGKVIYKIHPAFVTPIEFLPSRGKRVLVKTQAGAYRVNPNPMPGIGAATIIDVKKNLKINVN